MRTITLIISLLITVGCKSQVNNNLNKVKMKYFDSQYYKNWEKDTSYIIIPSTEQRLKRGEERVKITENDKVIQVEITSIKNPYCEIYTYDSTRKVLLSHGKTFYAMEIGTWEYYDIAEKVVRKINTYESFSFSLNELIKKNEERVWC